MSFWKRFSQDWQIRLYMILLAIFLWLVVVMTQVYETTVNVPVVPVNVGSDKILVSDVPKTVPVRFSGQGKDLFVLNFFRPAHLELDMQVVDNDFDYPLHTGLVEVPTGLPVQPTILPGQDMIPVRVEERLTIRLPVEPDTELRTRPGYLPGDTIKVVPDSVTVSGPRSMVARMKRVITEERIYVGLTDSFEESVPLLVPGKVEATPNAVTLNVTVNRLGERTIQRVQLTTRGLLPGRQVILEPSVLDVRVKGASPRLAQLDADSINAWIDLTRWNREQQEYVPTIDLPVGVELIDTTPDKIRVRLEVDSWR
ncbi:hypothetical protein KQI52_11745 [bacterium]|nr:hypothetical protein [bacterium]